MSPCRQGPTTHQSCQQTPTSLSSLFSHTELHSFTFYIFLSMSPTGSDLLSQRKLILDSVFQISNLSYYLSIIDYRRLFWRRTVISQNPADIRCLSATHLWPGWRFLQSDDTLIVAVFMTRDKWQRSYICYHLFFCFVLCTLGWADPTSIIH